MVSKKHFSNNMGRKFRGASKISGDEGVNKDGRVVNHNGLIANVQ